MKLRIVALAALLLLVSCGKPEPERVTVRAAARPSPTLETTSSTSTSTTSTTVEPTTTTVAAPVPTTRRSAPTPPAPVRPQGEKTLRATSTGPAPLDCGGYRTLIASFGLPPIFCSIVGCETGGTYNPAAVNGQHAGLTQLARRWHEARAARLGYPWARMLEAEPNLAVAADLWREQGLRPWEPSRYCWG